MTDKKPAWTGKLGADDKTTFAKPEKKNFFKLTEMPRATFPVKVIGKIRRGDIARQMLLQLPASVAERVEGAIQGANGPGLVALIEYALDSLDRSKKTILVENDE